MSSSKDDTTSNATVNSPSNKLSTTNAVILKSQENFIHSDYSECVKNLIIYFTSSLTSLTPDQQQQQTELNAAIQKLNSLIDDSNILKLKAAVNSLFVRFPSQNIGTLHPTIMLNNNEFFLALLSSNQTIINSLDSNKSLDKCLNILTTVYLNNLALAHYSLNKYNLSMLYFQKAFNQSAKSTAANLNNGEVSGSNYFWYIIKKQHHYSLLIQS